MHQGWYETIAKIVAVPVFIGVWIYCIFAYGFLLGVGLGWLPAMIVAVIAGFLWPFIALAFAGILLLILTQ